MIDILSAGVAAASSPTQPYTYVFCEVGFLRNFLASIEHAHGTGATTLPTREQWRAAVDQSRFAFSSDGVTSAENLLVHPEAFARNYLLGRKWVSTPSGSSPAGCYGSPTTSVTTRSSRRWHRRWASPGSGSGGSRQSSWAFRQVPIPPSPSRHAWTRSRTPPVRPRARLLSSGSVGSDVDGTGPSWHGCVAGAAPIRCGRVGGSDLGRTGPAGGPAAADPIGHTGRRSLGGPCSCWPPEATDKLTLTG